MAGSNRQAGFESDSWGRCRGFLYKHGHLSGEIITTSLRPHCDLTGIMVNKKNHPNMALFQVSELL